MGPQAQLTLSQLGCLLQGDSDRIGGTAPSVLDYYTIATWKGAKAKEKQGNAFLMWRCC